MAILNADTYKRYLLKINWDMYSDSDREDRSLHASQRLKKRIKHVIR